MNYFGKMLEYKYCHLTDIMLSFFRAVYNLGTTQAAALLFCMSSYFSNFPCLIFLLKHHESAQLCTGSIQI